MFWHSMARDASRSSRSRRRCPISSPMPSGTEYLDFCDFYYFAVPENFPKDILPVDHGLIVADRYAAAILRASPESPINASRRKAQTLAFAILAARRLRQLTDPKL